jgi:hypothetical protein
MYIFTCFVCASSWFFNNKRYSLLHGMNSSTVFLNNIYTYY